MAQGKGSRNGVETRGKLMQILTCLVSNYKVNSLAKFQQD